MKIYKTKKFEKLLKSTNLTDQVLLAACIEMSEGLIDADYGGHLYKKRIALSGSGKSGGYRSMIGAKIGERFFFLYLFPKSNKANINSSEKQALKSLAKIFVNYSEPRILSMVTDGSLIEIVTGENEHE